MLGMAMIAVLWLGLETLSEDENREFDMPIDKDSQRNDCAQKLRVELDKQGFKEVWHN
jgi:hypothetical protein